MPRTHRIRPLLALATLTALLAAGLAIPSAASAAGATITGTVTTDDGPLKSAVYLGLFKQQSVAGELTWISVDEALVSAAESQYFFDDMDLGVYQVRFYGDDVYYDAIETEPFTHDGVSESVKDLFALTFETFEIVGTTTPAADHVIAAYFDGGGWSGAGYVGTDADGDYELTVRADREYRVQFFPVDDGLDFVPQVFDGITWAGNIGDAPGATLVGVDNRTGVDAEFTSGGAISGFMTAQSPVTTSYPEIVQLLSVDAPHEVLVSYEVDNTSWLIPGVPPGDYLVRFGGGSSIDDPFARRVVQFYDGVNSDDPTADGVLAVSVAVGAVTEDVDAFLLDATAPLALEGVVTLSPASSVDITVERQHLDGSAWVRDYAALTSIEGGYADVIEQLGTYRFIYSAPGYRTHTSAEFQQDVGDLPDWDVTLFAEPTVPPPSPSPTPEPSHTASTDTTTDPVTSALTFSSAPKPTITGKAVVGKKLRVAVGTWSPRPAFSYQWFANGKKIKKATKATLKLSRALKGKKITVRITAQLSGHETVVVTSKASKKVR